MDNETQRQIIILIIIIILIKYFEFEEALIASYSIEQEEEEENSNGLFFNLINLQLNREEINNLKRLNRLISQYWFNEICLNMPDFEFKRHFRLTRSTFKWLYCEIILLLRRNSSETVMNLII